MEPLPPLASDVAVVEQHGPGDMKAVAAKGFAATADNGPGGERCPTNRTVPTYRYAQAAIARFRQTERDSSK
jgi:hypothetical protein